MECEDGGGIGGAALALGGFWPRCMPAGMPCDPKISQMGSSRPSLASGIL